MRIALGTPLSFKDFVKHSEAFSKTEEDTLFSHISTDSREAKSGDLFFSLTREKDSDEKHITEALEKGAKCVSAISKSASFLVKDTEKALLKLASYYKSLLPNLKATVAITGSVGKTTTKEFCAALLAVKKKVHKTYMNYNNALGVSLSILSAPFDTEILVLELGMNAPGEIRELSEAVTPDYAIITNVGNAHIGKLGSRELIARAKMEIVDGMKQDAVLAPYGEPLLSKVKYKFSLYDSEADFHLSPKSSENSFEFFRNAEKIIEFSSNYKASHLLAALTAALSLATLMGFEKEEMIMGVKSCSAVVLRQRLINFKHFSVIDDTYSSSPEAVKAQIEYIKLEYPERSFSVALGDMLELGHKTDLLHREIGNLAYTEGARKLYAFGAYAYLIRDGAKNAGMKDEDIYTSTELGDYSELAREIYKTCEDSEIILVKASHALLSEKIIEEIERLDKEC